jgi:uncharacterized protein (DUF1684 family)
MKRRLALLSPLLLLAAAPAFAAGSGAADAAVTRQAAAAAPAADAYRREMEHWRQERDAELKREDGWLTLVGLFWLEEGENRFGSGAGNRVIFPEGTAPAAGSFERHGKDVTVKAAPGVPLTHDGRAVDTMFLKSDADGRPTVLELGSLRFFVIQRGDRVGVRVKDVKSPALAAFHGIDSFPLRLDWRVDARFEPYNPPKNVPIPNILGQVADTPSPGAVVFEKDGKTYRLDALSGGDDGSLFVIFGDQTNGRETYGAGRFLGTDAPKDGHILVDFNKAYNPPCAFTSYATCPLPPRQNKLAVKVEAGEKKYGAGHPGR